MIDFCYNYTAYLEVQLFCYTNDLSQRDACDAMPPPPSRARVFPVALYMCGVYFVNYYFIINIIINIRRIYIVQFTHRTIHTYRCPRQPGKISCHFIDQHLGYIDRSVLLTRACTTFTFALLILSKIFT